MLRVYYLQTELIDGVETVLGIEHIRHAILETEDSLRKLIQDTIEEEHNALILLADTWREASTVEQQQFQLAEFPDLTPPPVFVPENPAHGIEQRLTNVEEFLKNTFSP